MQRRQRNRTRLDIMDNTWRKDTISPKEGREHNSKCQEVCDQEGLEKKRQKIFQLGIRKTFLTKPGKLQVAKSATEMERA